MNIVHVYSQEDISKGMSIYKTPPNNGMMFHLQGKYSTFHMKGVSFPLLVSLYDRDMRKIDVFVANPGDPPEDILYGIFYMLEIPMHLVQ